MIPSGWAGALGVTFAIQLATSFLSSTVSVSAPMLTAAAGVPLERIGYFSALSTVATMWYFTSCGPLLGRFGPMRLLQAGLVLSAVSMLVVIVGEWVAVLAAAALFGLGFGPIPAASSDILARRTPATRRGLAFSIKQAGVPIGHALGGLIVPALAVAFGWRAALVAACIVGVALALAVQPLRAGFDHGRLDTAGRIGWGRILSPANLAQPWRTLAAVPGIRWLTYAGFSLACAQGSLFSFFVAYLTADLGLALTAAGTAYATLQAAGAVGRIAAGWVADRISAVITLMLLGVSSCAALSLVASLSPAVPWAGIVAAAAFAGLAAVSWNGVYLAEVARMAPAGKVGDTTSASSFFTFIGYAAGPAIFSLLVEATVRYDLVFLVFAALPATGMLALAGARRAGRLAG